MAKILLIVAVIASLGTAVLGYFNKQKLAEAQEAVVAAEGTARTSRQNLESANKELADLKTSADTTAAESAKAVADLAAAQAELQKATAELTDAKGQVSQKSSEVESLTAQLTEAQRERDEARAGAPPAPVADGGGEAEVAELRAVVASLTSKNEQLESQVASEQEREKARTARVMQQGLEGRVLAVNPAWNFVILSIGDRNGVVNNAELLLKRGGQYLGKVRVTSVDPRTSVADIVANSLPSGVSVQPGDSVIYQSTTN